MNINNQFNAARAMGMGKVKELIGSPYAQLAQDYAIGAGTGIAGQQVANMVAGGADPDPLISGALMAPALGRVQRYSRGGVNPLYDNDYVQATAIGSAASMLGGGATNLYNTFAGGTDYDPNVAASVALLAGIAPLTYNLLKFKEVR